jgi:tetratricopeptide (TPR) repeat protein
VRAIAHRAIDELVGPRQAIMLRQLDAELPNIRAALEWLRDQNDVERLPPLAADLARFWIMRGLRREGLAWIDLAVPMVADQSSELRAYLYRGEGMLTNEQDSARALVAFEAAIAIHRAAGNRLEVARCLLGVSMAYNGNGLDGFEESVRAADEARDIAHELGDLRTEAAAIGNHAWAAIQFGDAGEGARLLMTSNELMRQTGDLHGAVIGLSAFGIYSRLRGDQAAALDQHLEALQMARQLGDPELIGLELLNMVIPHVDMGRWREAVEPWIEGATLVQVAGIEWAQIAALSIAVSLLHAAGDAEGAAHAWAFANDMAAERNVKLQPMDIDTDAVAAIEAAASGNAFIERSQGIRLEEAVEVTKVRVGALRGRGTSGRQNQP